MSSAIRGSKGLVAILQTAPLAVIPYLPNAADTRAQTRKKTIMFFLVIAGIAIALLLVFANARRIRRGSRAFEATREVLESDRRSLREPS